MINLNLKLKQEIILINLKRYTIHKKARSHLGIEPLRILPNRGGSLNHIANETLLTSGIYN